MGLLNTVRNFVFQNSYKDDDYLYEDDFETEEYDRYPRGHREDVVPYIDSRRPARESERSRTAKSRHGEVGDTVEFASRSAALKYSEKDRIYTLPSVSVTEMDIIVSDPLVFDDGLAICDLLKQRKPVIVNMENVEVKEAQRIMDFLAGVVYCVNGDIQEITSRIFIVAPENVNVSDHTKEHLKAQGIFSSFKTAFGGR
jgi:cell division inhibitor SepF